MNLKDIQIIRQGLNKILQTIKINQMKYLLLLLSIAHISCSKAQESKITIMGHTYHDININVEYVEYCNHQYRYEIHFSHPDFYFDIITDDVNDMQWAAIYNFSSNLTCTDGIIHPYDNAMTGYIISEDNYIDIIGEIGCECLQHDGSWKPIDANIHIEMYQININH